MTYRASLQNLMTSHGFELHRKNGKHLVWVNSRGQKLSTSSTPSCPHAINNVKRDLRKYVTAAA